MTLVIRFNDGDTLRLTGVTADELFAGGQRWAVVENTGRREHINLGNVNTVTEILPAAGIKPRIAEAQSRIDRVA